MSNNETAAKPASTSNIKPNRLPAPTLFVAPPSHNASQLSISRTNTHESTLKPTRDPLVRQQSALSRVHDAEPEHPETGDSGDPARANLTHNTTQLKKASEKSVEAKWKEMQSTLNEVELTAQNSTHVFAESHARALDDLRNAQVELARAWARGNEDKNIAAAASDSKEEVAGLDVARFSAAGDMVPPKRLRGDTDISASTALSGESGRSDTTTRDRRNRLEDETEQDIRLASERRAANEAYFKKVDGSVRDVVAKLQLVAEAMRSVETETRSLWSSASEGS